MNVSSENHKFHNENYHEIELAEKKKAPELDV